MSKWTDTLNYMFNPKAGIRENNELSKLLKIGGLHNTIDRTGLTESQKDLFICRQIPTILDTRELDVIIKERGVALCENFNNIHLMWSGGIDSTTAFYSLLATGKEFIVIFNSGSVKEYPYLANKLLVGDFPQVKILYDETRIPIYDYLANNPTATIVTGEIGDQTFGSSSVFNFNSEQRKLFIEDAVGIGLIDSEVYNYTKPKILSALKLNDMSTITLSTYLWAINFIFKYQVVQLRLGNIGLRTYNPLGNNNAVHFFDTDSFNSYALLNYQVNSNFEKDTDYKLPLKKYIFSQNGDLSYYENKTKEDSLTYKDFM